MPPPAAPAKISSCATKINGDDASLAHNSSRRGHDYIANSLHKIPQPPQKYNLRCAVKENHHHPIYCVAFSRHMHQHDSEDGDINCHSSVFATCGGNYSIIYEMIDSDKDDKESSITVRQVYRDVDADEIFYTCAFGGRGVVGSPVGFSNDDGEGFIKTGNRDNHGSSISIGHELIHQQIHQRSSIKKSGVKRHKVDDQHVTQQEQQPQNASGYSSFHLPYSASQQNGPPLLCIAGTRGIIKVIDTNQRSLHMTLSGHGNDITDLKFSPTNDWLLLSSSKDESVRLWNVLRGVNVAVFTGHHGHRGQVLSVSWHLSGSKVATCAMDNTVKLWRIFSDSSNRKNENQVVTRGGGNTTCGPIEKAVQKSFTVVPDDWSGNHDACRKFKTIFHQFPYFSTDEAHTNYVGKNE
jgi:hypothetical protein